MSEDERISGLADSLDRRIQAVWAAEWARADWCAALVAGCDRGELKAIAGELGRSARCIERWAALAADWPPEERFFEYSPRDHARRARIRHNGESSRPNRIREPEHSPQDAPGAPNGG